MVRVTCKRSSHCPGLQRVIGSSSKNPLRRIPATGVCHFKMVLDMKSDNWEYYIKDGSEFSSIKGNLVTIKDKATCPNYWFSGETTVVLGRTCSPELIVNIETVCSWEIINKHRDIQYIESCYLFIGCIRHFGGLHSTVYNSRVDIYLNKNQVDGFALRVIPESHSDYFHRIPESVIQKPKVIKDCKTIYSWTIHEDFLSESNKQTIELSLSQQKIFSPKQNIIST